MSWIIWKALYNVEEEEEKTGSSAILDSLDSFSFKFEHELST